jgi:alanine racemase
VRFGIAAFGVSPFDDVDAPGLGLEAPMTLSAPVLAVADLDAGHGFLGGLEYNLPEPARLALVAIGYADGVQSPAVDRAEVLIGGARRRVVALGVDRMLVDADDVSATPGDTVVLFGSDRRGEPTAEQWAAHADSIGDEIVVSVAPRVPRVYVN